MRNNKSVQPANAIPDLCGRHLYHGTGNLESIVADGFKAELTGRGNDQLGSGFYFTTSATEASGYASAVTPNVVASVEKLGGCASPGVVIAQLDIRNPIVVAGNSLHDAPIDITPTQAYEILKRAPKIFDPVESPVGNWFEIGDQRPVTQSMVRTVAMNYVGSTLIALEGDLFHNASGEFRRALREVLGFDGVVHKLSNGEFHYVAWFAEQIAPAFADIVEQQEAFNHCAVPMPIDRQR